MKRFFLILLSFMLVFNFYTVFAAVEEGSTEEICITFNSKTEIEAKYDVEKHQSWRIKLDKDVDSSTINEDNIYVLGYKNKKVSTKVSIKDDDIIITPVKNYELGERYFLILENIKTADGKGILDKVSMEFTIKEDPSVSIHDISNVKVNTYQNTRGHFGDYKVGSCQNVKLKRPENSTLKQDLSIFNRMLGNGSMKFNIYGQLAFSELQNEGLASSHVGFQLQRTKENEPLVCCWDWDDKGGTTYRRRIQCMNLAMEAFKYYARNPKDGEAIWAYIDEHVKARKNMCTGEIEKFGETKVKFVDPGFFGINVVFVNTGDTVNIKDKNDNPPLTEINENYTTRININEMCPYEGIYNSLYDVTFVKLNGKYGLINTKGEWMVEPKFEEVDSFYSQVTTVKYNGKYGVITRKGKWIIEPKFDDPKEVEKQFNMINFQEGPASIKFGEKFGNKCGYINEEGELIIEFKGKNKDEIVLGPFTEGLAAVSMGGKYGYINKEGKFVIEPKFDTAYRFTDGLGCVKLENKYGYINKEGKFVIEPKFDWARILVDGLACVKLGDKYGFINKEGKFAIQPKFDHIERDFIKGKAIVGYNGILYYINKKGEFIDEFDPTTYDPCRYGTSQYDDYFKKYKKYRPELFPLKSNDKYGYVNIHDEFIIQPQFDLAFTFCDNLAFVEYNGKYGFIDKQGNWVIKPQFDYECGDKDSGKFINGYAFVKSNGRYGVINKNGEWVIKPIINRFFYLENGYKQLEIAGRIEIVDENFNTVLNPDITEGFVLAGCENKLIRVKINNKWGFLNNDYQIIIKPQFDYAFGFIEDLAIVNFNDKFGFINEKGEFVMEPKFDRVSQFKEGLAWVQFNGKYGFIDKKGNWIIEPKFGDAFSFDDGLACVQFEGKYGLINKKGEFVVKPQYDCFTGFINKFAYVQLNGNIGLINRKGETILPCLYKNISSVSELGENLLIVKLHDSCKVINKDGTPRFDREFDSITELYNGYFGVTIDGKYGYMDDEGNFITPVK